MAVESTRVELCGRLADACGPFVDLTLPVEGLPVPELISILRERFPALLWQCRQFGQYRCLPPAYSPASR